MWNILAKKIQKFQEKLQSRRLVTGVNGDGDVL